MEQNTENLETIIDLLNRGVRLFANNTLTLDKRGGTWEEKSFTEIRDAARSFGAGLMLLGIKKGDRIALMSEGRREWLIAELGILYARAVNVPLSIKLDPEHEVSFRLPHSESRFLIVSEPQAKRIEEIKNKWSQLEGIIYLDDNNLGLSFSTICQNGKEWLANPDNSKIFADNVAQIRSDDVVNISYTSGTTSDPKGIMLTHGNYISNTLQSASLIKITPQDVTLTILPWDHSFAHTTCLYCMMYYGSTIASQEIGRTPMETLRNIPKKHKRGATNPHDERPCPLQSIPQEHRERYQTER